MRLFVAVDVGADVAAAAAQLIGRLRRRAARVAPEARIAWIPAERMHLTVRFIGYRQEPMITAILGALDEPIAVSPFDLEFSGTGAFPARGAPRVIWGGIAAGLDALGAVEQEVSRRLAVLGIPREDRPYQPHLTLARVRDAAGLRSAPLFAGIRGTALGTTHVQAITLYESRLSPNGPTYVPVRHTALWKSS